ncbi:hypothetical protein BRD08_10685 [Halobacteriales archaeon SW_10_66_29]|nr:MAG: hypothetical protein BRD08_10685 [Halobacteriales archaeon SW_10_66_29]
MSQRVQDLRSTVGESDVVERVLVPAVAAVAAMAIGFAVVGVAILLREEFIRGSTLMSYLALALMFLVPPFAAGLYLGRRQGFGLGPAVAAGVAPIVVLILALGAFGGPMATPFRAPLYTLAAMGGWTALCAGGMLAWTRLLGPRIDGPGATPEPDA